MSNNSVFLPDPTICGGQVWRQLEFPCMERYVVYLGDDKFVIIHSPRERGNIAASTNDGRVYFTADELEAHFKECKYTCLGQFAEYYIVMERKAADRAFGRLQELEG